MKNELRVHATRNSMPVVKVGRSRQVVIPKGIWQSLRLQEGDYFEVRADNGHLMFIPKKLVSRDELWYWSRAGQREIRQALREVVERKTKSFEGADELIAELNS